MVTRMAPRLVRGEILEQRSFSSRSNIGKGPTAWRSWTSDVRSDPAQIIRIRFKQDPTGSLPGILVVEVKDRVPSNGRFVDSTVSWFFSPFSGQLDRVVMSTVLRAVPVALQTGIAPAPVLTTQTTAGRNGFATGRLAGLFGRRP